MRKLSATWRTETLDATLNALAIDRTMIEQVIRDLKIDMATQQIGDDIVKKYSLKPLIAETTLPSDKVAEWAEQTLTGRWLSLGYVFFIQDEADIMLFTLKWS